MVLGSLKNLGFTGPEPMRASDRPRTLYAGTGTLDELVGVAVGASLAFARVSGGMGASPRSRCPYMTLSIRPQGSLCVDRTSVKWCQHRPTAQTSPITAGGCESGGLVAAIAVVVLRAASWPRTFWRPDVVRQCPACLSCPAWASWPSVGVVPGHVVPGIGVVIRVIGQALVTRGVMLHGSSKVRHSY
jgi:hypothetical protein